MLFTSWNERNDSRKFIFWCSKYIYKIYLAIFFTVANKCENFIILKINFLKNVISRISESFILCDFCFFVPNYFLPGCGASETSTHHNRTCSFDIRLTTAITSFKFQTVVTRHIWDNIARFAALIVSRNNGSHAHRSQRNAEGRESGSESKRGLKIISCFSTSFSIASYNVQFREIKKHFTLITFNNNI